MQSQQSAGEPDKEPENAVADMGRLVDLVEKNQGGAALEELGTQIIQRFFRAGGPARALDVIAEMAETAFEREHDVADSSTAQNNNKPTQDRNVDV
jgi:hypothetical protein